MRGKSWREDEEEEERGIRDPLRSLKGGKRVLKIVLRLCMTGAHGT